MKGLDKLKEKLPDYQGTKIRKFLVVAFIVFISSLLFQLIADSLPRFFRNIVILQILAPFFPILGSIIILTIGFTLVHSFWRARDKYLSEFGGLAYQKAFKFIVTSIPMIISVTVHGFFPSDFLVPFKDSQNLNWYLAYPILDLFFNFSIISLVIRLLFFFSLFSFLLVFMSKTLKAFGIDYMGLVYIYYPEDSTLQNHEIYSILRHPTYHSLMLLSIGGIFLRTSIYSIIYLIIFLIGFNIHTKFIEEKELIERFGEEYKKYKEKVPAFFVRVRDLKKYFSFVFKK